MTLKKYTKRKFESFLEIEHYHSCRLYDNYNKEKQIFSYKMNLDKTKEIGIFIF